MIVLLLLWLLWYGLFAISDLFWFVFSCCGLLFVDSFGFSSLVLCLDLVFWVCLLYW